MHPSASRSALAGSVAATGEKLQYEDTAGGLHALEQSDNKSIATLEGKDAKLHKRQQERLLLLRHASKCPQPAGQCTVTPHCGRMKELWLHIVQCENADCKLDHCVSSRYVLSHYSSCADTACQVCTPVREAIAKSYSKNLGTGRAPPASDSAARLTSSSSCSSSTGATARPAVAGTVKTRATSAVGAASLLSCSQCLDRMFARQCGPCDACATAEKVANNA